MRIIGSFLALSVAVSSQVAWGATTVRIEFSGHVDYGGDPAYTAEVLAQEASSLGWTIPDGTLFSGFFTFDSAAPVAPVQLAVPGESDYLFASPPWTLETSVGPLFTVPGTPPGSEYFQSPLPGYGYVIQVYDGTANGVDVGGAETRASSSIGSLPDHVFFSLELQGTPGSPLTSTALAAVPWDLSRYAAAFGRWEFDWDDGRGIDLFGVIDSVTVPEPSTAILAAAALLAVLSTRGSHCARE